MRWIKVSKTSRLGRKRKDAGDHRRGQGEN